MGILATSQITIVDLNDQVSLQSYLTSTAPKVQFITNNGVYTPNYSSENVTISAELYKIGTSEGNLIINSNVRAIRWYKKVGATTTWNQIIPSDTDFELVSTRGKHTSIKIKANIMNPSEPSLSIKCEIDYQESWMPESHVQKTELDYSLSVQGNNGVDGEDAYTMILTNESHSIACNSSGTPAGGEIGVSGHAKTSVVIYSGTSMLTPVSSDSPSQGQFSVKVKSGLTTGLEFIKESDHKTFYIDGTLQDSGVITLEATIGGYATKIEKIFTYTKVKAGVSGEDAYVVTLSNDSHVVPTDSNGSGGNYNGCQSTIYLYKGSQKITSDIEYSYSKSSGISGSGDSNGTFTVSNMTSDNGTVTLTSTYKNVDYSKVFSITKSKGGSSGQNATAYWMITSASALTAPKSLSSNKDMVEFLEDSFRATDGQTQFFIPEIDDAKDSLEIHVNNLNLIKNINYTKDGVVITVPAMQVGDLVKWKISKLYTQQSRKLDNQRTVISYTPSQIILSGKSQTGTSSPIDYKCRFRIEESIDNTNWIVKYTSNIDEASKIYTPSADIKAVKCTMYRAGGITDKLDEQTIPVLFDGADGENALSLDIVGEQIFTYDAANNVFPKAITLTANGKNFEVNNENIQWQYWQNDQWINTTKGISINITHDNSNWEGIQLKLKAYYTDRPTIFDEFTLHKIKDGKNNIVCYIFAPNGTVIKNDNMKSVPLESSIFWGGEDKSTDSKSQYRWERQNANGSWIIIRDFTAGSAGRTINVSASDIPNMLNVKCIMRYDGQEQTDSIVLTDQSDPFQALVISTNGDTFKNGQGITHLIAKILRGGEEHDVISIYETTPNTSGVQSGTIIYVKDSNKYKELLDGQWTNLSESPSKTNGKSKFTYTWSKYNEHGIPNPTPFGSGKIIRVTSDDIIQKANFVVQIED